MPQQRDLKAELKAGQAAFGCWLGLNSGAVAEIVAGAGYDFVLIDLEHGPGDPQEALTIMQAISAYPCVPLVRVPANEPLWIKRALDLGAAGIMVPSVETAAQAAQVADAARYPPLGRRGMAPTVIRASGYGVRWREYAAGFNERLLVICQVETAQAVENAAAIAAVDGVDLLFVGPFDLSGDLGYPAQPDHPDVRKAIAKVEGVAKAAGKLLGTIPTAERDVAALLAAGHLLLPCESDVGLLRDAAAQRRDRLAAAAKSR